MGSGRTGGTSAAGRLREAEAMMRRGEPPSGPGALEAVAGEMDRLRADNHLLARAWRGISPDRGAQTEEEADATEEAIEGAARRAMGAE